jgi:uncharacterized HAD superfamily protein
MNFLKSFPKMPKPENKPKLAVDIDEVMFPMAPTLLDYHNTVYGSDYRLDQMASYYLEDLTGETEEEMLTKIKSYLKTEHYTLGQPIEGSVNAIQKLRRKFSLAVVTSRDHFYRGSTEAFLQDNFGGLYDELHYTHTEDNPNITIPKYAICETIGAIALIDDNLSNIISCAERSMSGVLFGNYPWNQVDKLPDNVVRVNNWQEVLEYFDAKG